MAKFFSATLVFVALIACNLNTAAAHQQKLEQQHAASGQDNAKPGQRSTENKKEKAAPIQRPTTRLVSAKSVFIVRTHGGKIPFETIRTTIDGWDRFTVVESADKADLIVEVASAGGDDDVRVSSNMSPSIQTGRMEQSTSSSKDISSTEVSMTVLDAQSKHVLWRGTESAKYAMRQKARENNLVEAAEKLAAKFHARLEPPGR